MKINKIKRFWLRAGGAFFVHRDREWCSDKIYEKVIKAAPEEKLGLAVVVFNFIDPRVAL